jgi:hypothetical protein
LRYGRPKPDAGDERFTYTPDMTFQSVSKLDAATRQLHLAIRLYFQEADPLGFHTLAGAAHRILEDLSRKRGHGVSLESKGLQVQSGHHAIVMRNIRDAKNFLKHADRDPDAMLTFHPDWTDFLMMDAIQMHTGLTATIHLPDAIFLIWVSTKYPEVLLLDSTIFSSTAAGLRSVFASLEGSDKKRAFVKALEKSQVLSESARPADGKGKPKKPVLKLVPKPTRPK